MKLFFRKNLFASLLLILLLACSPLRQYRNTPQVTKWEPDIANFEQLDRTEDYEDNAVLFTGSSSIRLWSTLKDDMSPYPVIQRGFGGSRLSDLAVYADRLFSPHKCSALVIFVANDITGGKEDKTPEEVRKLFISVLRTFRKTHKDESVFWIAITPTPSRWKVWPEIRKVNELIREECENRRNTYFIKTENAFLNENGMPRDNLFVADKLHLNPEGYRIWTGIIKTELDKVLKGNN